MSKKFKLGGRTGLELIAEGFNLFNAKNPAGFIANQQANNFGQATAFAGDFQRGEQRCSSSGSVSSSRLSRCHVGSFGGAGSFPAPVFFLNAARRRSIAPSAPAWAPRPRSGVVTEFRCAASESQRQR